MTGKVRTAQIVRYHGSVTAEHGLWYVDGAVGPGRYDLMDGSRRLLHGAHATSFTAVDVPALTPHRAWALKDMRDGVRPDTRTLNWLAANGLVDGNNLTALGRVLAEATLIY